MRAPRPISLDADLRRWREQFPGATAIAELRPRQHQQLVGVVERILVTPGSSLTMRVSDGTGTVDAVWSQRAQLLGVTLGSALLLTATVAESADGRPLLRNPAWSPVAEPFSFPP